MKNLIPLLPISLSIEEANYVLSNSISSEPILMVCKDCSDKMMLICADAEKFILDENNHVQIFGTCVKCQRKLEDLADFSLEAERIQQEKEEGIYDGRPLSDERIQLVRLLRTSGIPLSQVAELR